MKILEHNIETGEVIQRDMTKDELAQYKIDEAIEAAKTKEAQAKSESKAALLARLGITEEEAVLLIG